MIRLKFLLDTLPHSLPSRPTVLPPPPLPDIAYKNIWKRVVAIKYTGEPRLVRGGKEKESVEFRARKSKARSYFIGLLSYFFIFKAPYHDCPKELLHDCKLVIRCTELNIGKSVNSWK